MTLSAREALPALAPAAFLDDDLDRFRSYRHWLARR